MIHAVAIALVVFFLIACLDQVLFMALIGLAFVGVPLSLVWAGIVLFAGHSGPVRHVGVQAAPTSLAASIGSWLFVLALVAFAVWALTPTRKD